jgi:hypothetical protein
MRRLHHRVHAIGGLAFCRRMCWRSVCPWPRLISTENPDGFLSMKDFQRAVNVEMPAIMKMKVLD